MELVKQLSFVEDLSEVVSGLNDSMDLFNQHLNQSEIDQAGDLLPVITGRCSELIAYGEIFHGYFRDEFNHTIVEAVSHAIETQIEKIEHFWAVEMLTFVDAVEKKADHEDQGVKQEDSKVDMSAEELMDMLHTGEAEAQWDDKSEQMLNKLNVKEDYRDLEDFLGDMFK